MKNNFPSVPGVLKCTLGATLISLTLSGSVPGTEKPVKPNIILICAGDLGWSDIGCYGSEVKTPNLDQLAVNGMRIL